MGKEQKTSIRHLLIRTIAVEWNTTLRLCLALYSIPTIVGIIESKLSHSLEIFAKVNYEDLNFTYTSEMETWNLEWEFTNTTIKTAYDCVQVQKSQIIQHVSLQRPRAAAVSGHKHNCVTRCVFHEVAGLQGCSTVKVPLYIHANYW